MSTELLILIGLIFLTPFGWIGMICLGAGIGLIFQGIRGKLH